MSEAEALPRRDRLPSRQLADLPQRAVKPRQGRDRLQEREGIRAEVPIETEAGSLADGVTRGV